MAGKPEIVRVSDAGLLPLIARLPGDPPRLFLKAGRVGGAEGEPGSLAISDRDADLALDAALASGAEWEGDPDLGVDLLVSDVPGVDQGLLVPRFLYRRSDRIYEYAAAMPAVLREYEAVLKAHSSSGSSSGTL